MQCEFDYLSQYLQASNRIFLSGKFNFQEVKFEIRQFWNLTLFEELLSGYHDKDVITFCKFGWPISHFGNFGNTQCVENWKGAKLYPVEIRKYLQKEIDCKAVLGPFLKNPFNRPCFFSPLNTRDRRDSTQKRIILDLSFPMGNSVNGGVDKSKYLGNDIVFKFPTVDK